MQPAVDGIGCMNVADKKNILVRSRARTGVDPFNAQNLALKISLQGYSESKLENPMGFEKAASGPAASAQKDFMKKELRLFRRLSADCSHTFAAANIIEGSDVRNGKRHRHKPNFQKQQQ